MNIWRRWFCILFAWLAFESASVSLFANTNTLVWHRQQQRVDADISTWDLRLLLEHVATATGWHVYLDPKAIHPISAKFKDLAVGPALHSLLGDVNFVVVPQTNGPSRLYVFRTSQSEATTLVAPVRKIAEPIPNELIVTLKPNSKTKIEDLARSLHAKIIGRMDSQNAYLLQFDDDVATQAARQALANNPDVASVDYNYPIDQPPTPFSSESGLPDLNLKPTPTNGNCAVVIGLIDTQVQSLGSAMDKFILPQANVAGDASPSDQLTHGTAMAETIIDSIAKIENGTSIKIQPVNVYGNNEQTTSFDVAAGIDRAVLLSGANIINLSLGGTGDSQVLHNTIINYKNAGVTFYAAAGNEPVTTPTYPAAYPEVISVTATDNTGHIASYANRGSFIDMTAPGDNVVGFNGQNFLVEGTSTSTAFATGAAAGLADSTHACADQAQSLLQKALPKAAVLKTTP